MFSGLLRTLHRALLCWDLQETTVPQGSISATKLHLQAATKVLRGPGGEGEGPNREESYKNFWLQTECCRL